MMRTAMTSAVAGALQRGSLGHHLAEQAHAEGGGGIEGVAGFAEGVVAVGVEHAGLGEEECSAAHRTHAA